MANKTDHVPGALQKIRYGDVSNNRADSEGIMTKISANINYLSDAFSSSFGFNYGGNFRPTSISTGYKVEVIKRRSFINWFIFSLYNTGAGQSGLDVHIRNSSGAYVGLLFSSTPFISATSKANLYIGRDVVNSSNILGGNFSGVTYNIPVLNYSYLEEGWQIYTSIGSNGLGAQGMSIQFNLSEV